jgi:nitrous oxidase accessory protein NosD
MHCLLRPPVTLLAIVGLLLPLQDVSAANAVKTITKLPFIITKSGTYRLGKDVDFTPTATALYAITIASDDVVLDLSGFRLRSTGTVSQNLESAAVFAFNRRNVTVRNGIVQGFFRGIFLESNDLTLGGQMIERVESLNSTFLGLQLKGRGATIRNCRVHTVAGSVAFDDVRYGIDIQGDEAVVSDNTVQDIFAGDQVSNPAGFGIRAQFAPNAVIENNRVLNTSASSTAFTSIGVGILDCANAVITRNIVARHSAGIYLINSLSATYRDNTVTGAFDDNSEYVDITGNARAGSGND